MRVCVCVSVKNVLVVVVVVVVVVCVCACVRACVCTSVYSQRAKYCQNMDKVACIKHKATCANAAHSIMILAPGAQSTLPWQG